MNDKRPEGFGDPVPADEVIDNLSENLEQIDDVDALNMMENLLSTSPILDENDGAYRISYLTLARKFLEITRNIRDIDEFYESYFSQIDADNMSPEAHPKRLEAMTSKGAKQIELSDDLIIFYSLAQEVITYLSIKLCRMQIDSTNRLKFDNSIVSEKWERRLKSDITSENDPREIADSHLSQPEREKYLWYRGVINKEVHNDMVHARSNLRNKLIHNVKSRKSLEQFGDYESELRKCVGAINTLSMLADDEIAIQVRRADSDTPMITDSSLIS